MTINMLQAIDLEIEDRTTQASESGEAEKYEDELKALAELKKKLEQQLPLTYKEYEWLADISAAMVEAQTREELE